jgi:hypothetical protein
MMKANHEKAKVNRGNLNAWREEMMADQEVGKTTDFEANPEETTEARLECEEPTLGDMKACHETTPATKRRRYIQRRFSQQQYPQPDRCMYPLVESHDSRIWS